MTDDYKDFDEAEWKSGGGSGGYDDLTLNKANGGAWPAAAAKGAVDGTPQARSAAAHRHATAAPPLKGAPPLPDPYGRPSDSSQQGLFAAGGKGRRGGLWVHHRRLILATVLVGLIAAIAIGVGLGVTLGRRTSCTAPTITFPPTRVTAMQGEDTSAYNVLRALRVCIFLQVRVDDCHLLRQRLC